MNLSSDLFLPGSDKQLKFFIENVNVENKKILVIGSNSEEIAKKLFKISGTGVEVIVDVYESLAVSKAKVKNEDGVRVRLMDYSNTDFRGEAFDVIYSQGAISLTSRNKIIKELRNILKPEGILCVGEITALKKESPVFLKEIWERANMAPLYTENFLNFYEERGFEAIDAIDLSDTLEKFYKQSRDLLKKNLDNLQENEKSYYKKTIKMIKHETDAFLNRGADKLIGMKAGIFKKRSA